MDKPLSGSQKKRIASKRNRHTGYINAFKDSVLKKTTHIVTLGSQKYAKTADKIAREPALSASGEQLLDEIGNPLFREFIIDHGTFVKIPNAQVEG